MSALTFTIPVAIGLGLLGLVAFLWSLRTGQYDDLDGAAERILDDDETLPLPELGKRNRNPKKKRRN